MVSRNKCSPPISTLIQPLYQSTMVCLHKTAPSHIAFLFDSLSNMQEWPSVFSSSTTLLLPGENDRWHNNYQDRMQTLDIGDCFSWRSPQLNREYQQTGSRTAAIEYCLNKEEGDSRISNEPFSKWPGIRIPIQEVLNILGLHSAFLRFLLALLFCRHPCFSPGTPFFWPCLIQLRTRNRHRKIPRKSQRTASLPLQILKTSQKIRESNVGSIKGSEKYRSQHEKGIFS